jgi:hypothetical protein
MEDIGSLPVWRRFDRNLVSENQETASTPEVPMVFEAAAGNLSIPLEPWLLEGIRFNWGLAQ